MFHAYGNENKERIAILTANKIDFRPDCWKGQGRSLYNDKRINSSRGYNISKYKPTIETPKYIKQMLTNLKKEIDHNTI